MLVVLSCVVVPSTCKFPETVTLPDAVMAPVTASVEPLNVRFPLSSSSPEVPAITTRLSVRSEILAVDATRPEPPVISAPPLKSAAPVNVDKPVTFTAANVAPPDPPKIDSDSFSNVTFPVSYTHLTLPTNREV